MGIRVRIKKWEGIPVVSVGGKADSGDVLSVARKIEGLVKKAKEIAVLDLGEMAFLDSNWMGVLISCWKLYKAKGKQLIFCVPPGFIRDLFRNAGLDRVFTFICTLEDLRKPPEGSPRQ